MDAQYLHDLGTAVGIGVSVAMREWKKSAKLESDESQGVNSSKGRGGNTLHGRGGSWRANSWRGNSQRGSSYRGNSWRGNSWRGNSWRGNSRRGNSWRGSSWRGRGAFWRGRGAQQKWYSPQERKEYKKKNEIEDKICKDIERTIAQEDMIIFCKSDSPNCKTATDIVDDLKMKYISFVIDEWENSDVVNSVLEKLTNTSSFPKIFVKNKYIGELNGLKKYIENQKANDTENELMLCN